MKNVKKIVLTACSLVLSPIFLSNAKASNQEGYLSPGCYHVESGSESMELCVQEGASIYPIDGVNGGGVIPDEIIEHIETSVDGQPVSVKI